LSLAFASLLLLYISFCKFQYNVNVLLAGPFVPFDYLKIDFFTGVLNSFSDPAFSHSLRYTVLVEKVAL
jgi:hypothetical protein